MADGIDTSIYRQQQNPLGTISNIFGIMNAAQTNQLLQQQQQIRQFELEQGQNAAVNSIIGSLKTIPNLDANTAKNIILPQMRSMGLDPATSPIARQHLGPLLRGELNDPKEFQTWISGHAAPMLGAGGFAPTTAPAGPEGEARQELPIERAARTGAPVVTGLGPADVRRLTIAGEQYAGATATAGDWQNRSVSLTQAIPLLEKLGPTGTGFAGETKNEIRRIIVALGGKPDDAADYEKARKYLLRDAMTTGDIGSNEKLYNTIASNPNIDLTQASALDLAKMNLAQARIKQVQLLEAKRQGITAGTFPGWSADWNTRQDPRAYIMDMATSKTRAELTKQMKTWYQTGTQAQKQEAQQFLESYKAARRQPGIINTSRYQSGP